MVDRQDIDALLIGALYGELTPAEEARLQAHLESHPADRGALDDLKSARQAVRESKIFEASAEPPQAISAMLLQEAARRAPRKAPVADDKESWFARFVRSFMMHPAMAAAATLVLVVGVAGSLYLAKGSDQVADKRAVQEPETAASPQLAQDQPAPAAGEAAGSGSGSGFDVGLADKNELARSESTNVPVTKGDNERQQATRPAIAQAPAAHHATKGITYDRAEPQPKDLDSGKESASDDETVATGAEGQGAVGGVATNTGFAAPPRGASGTGGAGPGAAPPPPAQQGSVASTPARRPAAAPATTAPAPAPAEEPQVQQPQVAPVAKTAKAGNKPVEPIAWARDQHSRAVQLTSTGHCDDAAKIVLAIEAKAPAYYADHVATDRALKPCMPYFEGAREKRAEHDRPKAAPANADENK